MAIENPQNHKTLIEIAPFIITALLSLYFIYDGAKGIIKSYKNHKK